MRSNVLLLAIATLFWIDATTTKAGFSADTWGYFSYQYPAAMWAFIMMAASAITINGLLLPTKHWMVIVGCAMQLIQFSAIAYSAIFTGGEFVVGIYAGLYFAPMFALALREAIKD